MASLCTPIVYAQAETSGPAGEADLLAACRAASTAFHPLTAADLQQAKGELLSAVERLDKRLAAAGEIGDQWREFLDWDRLKAALPRDGNPDLETLDDLYPRYLAGIEGLNLVWFLDVRQALREYRTKARAMGAAALQEQYEKRIEALCAELASYRQAPSPAAAGAISQTLEWLSERGQAQALVERIRRELSHPNVYVQVSGELIAAAMSRPVDDVSPVREDILGADVRGTGHTVGRLTVELVPAEDHAEIRALLTGTIDSDTIGYRGPVRLYSRGRTRVRTQKRVFIDAQRLWAEPSQSEAVTNNTMTGICAVRGGPLVVRIAQRQAAKKKCQADAIAAERAEMRVNSRLEKEAAQPLGRLRELLVDKLRRPLVERKLFPPLLRFSTTRTALHVTAMEVGPFSLGAPNLPPPAAPADLLVRVHESSINNFAEAALGGAVLDPDRVKSMAEQFLGSLPKELESDQADAAWKVLFARREPLFVTFDGGRIRITLRGRAYAEGGQVFPGLDATAFYDIRRQDGTFVAVRQSPLVFHPPGTEPAQSEELSARQVAMIPMLRRRLDKLMPERWTPENVAPAGKWIQPGELALQQWTAAGGWMTMSWQRVSKEAAPVPATSTTPLSAPAP